MPTEKTLDEIFQALVDSATYVQEPMQRHALLKPLYFELELLDAFCNWVNDQLSTTETVKRLLRWIDYFGPHFEILLETYFPITETDKPLEQLIALYILVVRNVNKLKWGNFENFQSQFDSLHQLFPNIFHSVNRTLYFLKWNRAPTSTEGIFPIMLHDVSIHYWNLQGITLQGITPASLDLKGANIANINSALSELDKCDLENSFNLASAKKATLKHLVLMIDKIKTFDDLLKLYEKQKNGFLFHHQNSSAALFSWLISPPKHAQKFIEHLQTAINRLLKNNHSLQENEKKALETLNTFKFVTKIDASVDSSSNSIKLTLLP